MDAPALEDRHPLLHPQQRLVGRRAAPAGTRPAAIARVRGEKLRKGGAGRTQAGASARPAPLGELRIAGGIRPRGFRRRRPGKGLLPHDLQRSCSSFVLFPAIGGQELIRATRRACVDRRAALASPPGMPRCRARCGRAPAATAPRRHDRCRSRPRGRSHGRARARRSARRSRPAATRRPGSAPAACRRAARKRRLVDVMARRSARTARGRWCWS